MVREIITGKPRKYSVVEAGRRVCFKKGDLGNQCILLRGQTP